MVSFTGDLAWNDTGAIQLSIQRWVRALSSGRRTVLTTPSETYFRSGPSSHVLCNRVVAYMCEKKREEEEENRKINRRERKRENGRNREKEKEREEGIEETEGKKGKMDPLQGMVS